jgi:hypothetical protein
MQKEKGGRKEETIQVMWDNFKWYIMDFWNDIMKKLVELCPEKKKKGKKIWRKLFLKNHLKISEIYFEDICQMSKTIGKKIY